MAYRKTTFVENKRKATRDRITRAARKLVNSGGWSNCSLNKVSKGAEVSAGSIYTHFGKITDLYTEVFLHIADEEVAVIASIAIADTPALDRFIAAVNTFSGRALKGRAKAYAVIAEPVAPEVDATRQRYHAKFIEQYESIIASGVEAGVFRRQNSRVSASCVFGALVETLVMPLSPEDTFPTDSDQRIQEDILLFCLNAVGAPIDFTPNQCSRGALNEQTNQS